MSTGVDEAAASTSRNVGTPSTNVTPTDTAAPSAADQTFGSVSFRNGVTSPGSPGSEADSTINSTVFAPSILASRLGRSIYSSAGAASSSLSLTGSGFNSPTLALTGFNAVSTVLNNPSKRQHPIDPKSSRFPPITPNHVPADIPKVKKAQLETYLSSVRPEWDRFMRNQSMGRQGKATIEQQQQRRSSAQDSSFDSEPLGNVNPRQRATSSNASLSSDLQAVPPPQARKRLPNLSTVPQVFFSEEFDLGNPYTFDQVTERHKVAATSPADPNGGVSPTYDVALNQMLQEKLSYYSDVIEQHLIIEIGQQSSSFFAALENLNDLNAEAESCLRKINHLQSELENIDENQAKKGLRVIQQQQHRRHLERQQSVVQDVRQLVERRDLVRLLLQQGETEEALDLLNKLRSALHPTESDQEPSKSNANGAAAVDTPISLSDLQCLATIPPQLDEMEKTLSGMLQQDLVAILTQDIEARLAIYSKDRVSSASSADGDSYFANAAASSGQPSLNAVASTNEPPLTPSKTPASPFVHSSDSLSQRDSELASRIAPLVVGLARTGGIEEIVAAYREVAIQAVKETWKATLSKPSADMAETAQWLLSEDLSKFDDHEVLPAPAARIRDLDHVAFINMGRELFETLMECLKAVDAQCKLVLRILHQLASSASSAQTPPVDRDNNADAFAPDIATSSGDSSPPTMPTGVPTTLPAKLSEVVVASAEQAHSLCARLLSLRATTHAALELPSFLIVFQLCWSFVLSSEQLCRKMIVGLRGTVLGQAKGFLATFHRRRIERAAKAVEEETWAQAEVGTLIQAQIRHIVSSAVQDPAAFIVTGSKIHLDSPAKATGEAEVDQDAAAASAKTLDIEDRQYFVVDASLDVLALLVDYLKVIINLPLLTTEAMARVVEFLKQFNSRTCQVVLGAGAMRSAGLKNITAKHLALASQSLSIMISLIPYIRETVRRHLSPKQAVMLTEFDKLRRDFQEHQYEIHAKLVAIMSDRLTVHCRTMSALDWNADKVVANNQQQGDESKDAEPHKYAADLVKETATLHKVLSKYLQPVVVEHVIGQVLRAIDTRVAQELEKIPVQNQAALDCMETDVRYLGTKLSVLKHVEWKDEALQQVLAAKHVPQAPPTHAMASAGSSTPSSEAVPGSPAGDKPAASPFGPVTYKPRIPNIFARRQQQQLSQSGSPRASTDVPGASTPIEPQRSVESTPRTSLQMQQQSSQPATATAAPGQDATAEDRQEPSTNALESSARPSTSGARSIEDEANDTPPTPPSKGEEILSTIIVRTDDADARESEDLVAPVLPAPDAVAKVLAENGRSSTELSQKAPSLDTDTGAESIQQDAFTNGQGAETASHDQPDQASATAAVPTTSHSDIHVEATQKASEDTTKSDDVRVSTANTPAVNSSTMIESGEAQRPSTPKKDAPSTCAPQIHGGVARATAVASPVHSGTSTPAATPTGTPAKPGRMSLKERLAEAARKRAQQSVSIAQPTSQSDATATATSSAQPSETSPVEVASASADKTTAEAKTQGKDASAASEAERTEPSAQVTSETQATDASAAATDAADSKAKDSDAGAVGEADKSSEKGSNKTGEALEHDATESNEEIVATEESKESAQAASESPHDATGIDASNHASPNTSKEAKSDVPKQAEAMEQPPSDADAAAETTVEPMSSTLTSNNDQQAGETDNEARTTLSTSTGVDAAAQGSKDGTHATEAGENANGDANGDGDGDGDGDDADADADANETTNDSTPGGGSGASSKKNKKKKKKGKKK